MVKKNAMSTYSSRPDSHDDHPNDTSPERSDEQRWNEDAARHGQAVSPRRQQVVNAAEDHQRQYAPLIYRITTHTLHLISVANTHKPLISYFLSSNKNINESINYFFKS